MSGENKVPTSDAAQEPSMTPEFSGDTPEEAMAKIRGYLKAYKRIISAPAPVPSAEQARAFEGYRGVVAIAREIEKGPDGNRVIVEQADLLKAAYVDKLTGTAMPPAPTAAPPVPQNGREFGPASAAATAYSISVPMADAPRPAVPLRVPAQATVDKNGNRIPAFQMDRRYVPRAPSDKPLFSDISEEYLRPCGRMESSVSIGFSLRICCDS